MHTAYIYFIRVKFRKYRQPDTDEKEKNEMQRLVKTTPRRGTSNVLRILNLTGSETQVK